MNRYEKIMHDVEKMASELPDNERYQFKARWLKTEIRKLCDEIEVLEEQASQEICPTCKGIGEYQTESGWLGCHACEGKGFL